MICLLCVTILSVCSGSVSAENGPVRTIASAKQTAKSAQLERVKVVQAKKAINFNRNDAWKWQKLANKPLSRTSYAERRVNSLTFLRWEAKLWNQRRLAAKKYVRTHPWVNLIRRTYQFRQCIMGHESSTSGGYKAENGGTRYVEGAGHSNASGAYQFLDSTWVTRLTAAKRYFGNRLKGFWTHAADAPPQVQDIVAAYGIAAALEHHKPTDWTWPDCQAIGLASAL
jgi:hypothetical protein